MNDTFCSKHYNCDGLSAVVGKNNGGMENYAYLSGFAEAFFILASAAEFEEYYDSEEVRNARKEDDEILAKYANIDSLIYPMCFCARHYIELFLKQNIEALPSINSQNIDLNKIHNIETLWGKFVEGTNFDERLKKIVKEMEPIISDFSNIDPTSQTFRYPTNKESQLHLKDLDIICLRNLVSNFKKLTKDIEEYEFTCEYLFSEYSTGTTTSKLSRYDIEKIAKELPPKESWRETIFDDVKKKIRNQYSLSSNDFSKAVNIIKKHREFSQYINLEIRIPELTNDLVSRLSKIINENSDLSLINMEEWATLYAVCKVGSLGVYSENYDSIRNEPNISFLNERHSYNHVSSKSYNLEKGLKKLGQNSFLALVEKEIPSILEEF